MRGEASPARAPLQLGSTDAVLAWLVEYRFGPGSADKAPTRTRFRQDCDSDPRPRHVKRAGGRG